MGMSNAAVKPQPNLNPQQAVLTIAIGAIAADGDIANEEIVRLHALCAVSPLFAAIPVEAKQAMMQYCMNLLSEIGLSQAVTLSAEALNPELRETAFALACDMVAADGVLQGAEEKYMTALMAMLEISPQLAERIVHVTKIRNRNA